MSIELRETEVEAVSMWDYSSGCVPPKVAHRKDGSSSDPYADVEEHVGLDTEENAELLQCRFVGIVPSSLILDRPFELRETSGKRCFSIKRRAAERQMGGIGIKVCPNLDQF